MPSSTINSQLLPQAARIVLPPVGNYAIGLLKDTSLCTLIGVNELVNGAKAMAEQLGVARSTLSNVLARREAPSAALAVKIRAFLDSPGPD